MTTALDFAAAFEAAASAAGILASTAVDPIEKGIATVTAAALEVAAIAIRDSQKTPEQIAASIRKAVDIAPDVTAQDASIAAVVHARFPDEQTAPNIPLPPGKPDTSAR